MTNGIIFSQRIMLELTKNGFSREKAYTIVQKHAQKAWKENITFFESLNKDKMIKDKINSVNLKKMFNLSYHTKKINIIFNRIFK